MLLPQMDSKGRIMIPCKVRKDMNLKPGDSFHVKQSGKVILLGKINV